MKTICINKKDGQKLELSKNWIYVEDKSPEYDEVVIVMYREFSTNYWDHYTVTVAKYKEYDEWIDCLNLNNSDLEPLYWRPLPGEMD